MKKLKPAQSAIIAVSLLLTGSLSFAQALYTQTGTDADWQTVKTSGNFPFPHDNSYVGYLGSDIDVNNDLVESTEIAKRPLEQNIYLHTVGNGLLTRPDFPRWSRWYQEDGNIQVFRLFKGEENVRNERAFKARTEAWTQLSWTRDDDVWYEWHSHITFIKPYGASIFQLFNDDALWGLHINMKGNGDLEVVQRRPKIRKIIATDMVGKGFDITVRDNGHDFEVIYNGELVFTGDFDRPLARNTFRWGMYIGSSVMRDDAMLFFSGTSLTVNGEPVKIEQTPFKGTPIALPGIIQTEDYDDGGEGVAYHDRTPKNDGNVGRTFEYADFIQTPDGGQALSSIWDTEWLEHTVNIAKAGNYHFDLYASSTHSNGRVTLLLDGTPLATGIAIKQTSDEQVYQTTTVENVTLPAGQHVIRTLFDVGGFNLDHIEVIASDTSSDPADPSKSRNSSGGSVSWMFLTMFMLGAYRRLIK